MIGPTAAISTRPERESVMMSSSTPSRRAAASHSAAPGALREQHGVDFAGGRRGDRSADDRLVRRRSPAIDGEAHDLGAVRLEELVEAVGT